MLTGWSAAGILGPLVAGQVFDWKHAYPPIFIMAGVLFCMAAPISVILQVLAFRQLSIEATKAHEVKDTSQLHFDDIVLEIDNNDGKEQTASTESGTGKSDSTPPSEGDASAPLPAPRRYSEGQCCKMAARTLLLQC